MQYEIHSRPDMDERPQWSPPRETATPEPSHAPSHAPRPEPVAEAASAPQRRRSTVREPAPSFTASEPVVTPTAPQPAAPPPAAAAESVPADDAAKPRRTGWWAKKLLGGDKG